MDKITTVSLVVNALLVVVGILLFFRKQARMIDKGSIENAVSLTDAVTKLNSSVNENMNELDKRIEIVKRNMQEAHDLERKDDEKRIQMYSKINDEWVKIVFGLQKEMHKEHVVSQELYSVLMEWMEFDVIPEKTKLLAVEKLLEAEGLLNDDLRMKMQGLIKREEETK